MEVEWRKRMDGLNAEKQQVELLQKDLEQKRQQQETELKLRLEEEKKTMQETLSLELKKNIAQEYDTQLKHFEQLLNEKDEKIKKL